MHGHIVERHNPSPRWMILKRISGFKAFLKLIRLIQGIVGGQTGATRGGGRAWRINGVEGGLKLGCMMMTQRQEV